MDLYASIVIVVSIIGFALILAITWLVYKWRQTVPSTTHTTDDHLPPMQRLVVDRGRVVPASSVKARPMSIFSTISSVRFSIMPRRKSLASRRGTRNTFTDLENGRSSRISTRSHTTYIDFDAPPLPGMPPQPAQLVALDKRAATHIDRITSSLDARRSSASPVDPPPPAAQHAWTPRPIPEESPALTPMTTHSSKSTPSFKTPPNSPLFSTDARHRYSSLGDGLESTSSSRRTSLRSKYHVNPSPPSPEAHP